MKRPIVEDEAEHIIAQFVSADGNKSGSQIDLPLDFGEQHLQELLNAVLSNEEPLPYSFFVNAEEFFGDLKSFLEKRSISKESVLQIVYRPQAVFRVRSLTRCTSTLPGHTDSVLSCAFSPDGSMLASGSGDKSVRLWDLHTQTPTATCLGHTGWVLCIAWSPDAKQLASGSHDSTICLWNPHAGEEKDRSKPRLVLRGHRKWVTALSWQPLHRSMGKGARKLLSSSKDGSAKIWDTVSGTCIQTLGGHSLSVTAVKWGGEGLIYTASQDTTINVWAVAEEHNFEAKLIRQLKDHAHWINTLALSNDHLLRSGPFDHTTTLESFETAEQAYEAAKKRYEKENAAHREMLVSGSDDFTMYLWNPTQTHKPVARLLGHQQLINSVAFSPDGSYIASGSFDKSVRVWNGLDGKFVCTFRGHVGAVYHVVWSSDGRMLLSASKDSTVKLWSMRTRRLEEDLPGHADEVYACDWAPDGGFAASGGKDRVLKIWHN